MMDVLELSDLPKYKRDPNVRTRYYSNGLEGHTYFIQVETEGPIKIGFTQDCPRKRLGTIQYANHMKLSIALLIKGDYEKDLHYQWKEHRIRGEWHAYTGKFRKLIERLKKKATVISIAAK